MGIANRISSRIGWHARVFAGMLLCIAAAEAARGQCLPEWTQRFDVPAHRRFADATFDVTRGRVVMYGGRGNSGKLNDLWEWDGQRWVLDPIPGPSLGVGGSTQGLVCDTDRGVLVLFARPVSGAETWEFHGRRWRLRSRGGPQTNGDK